MKISQNFYLDEFLASDIATRHGVSNIPTSPDIEANIVRLAAVMERVREALFGSPIQILSGYRCQALNDLVGGSANSAHMQGLAADFVCRGFGSTTNIVACLAKFADVLQFDQLICEGAWVHLGLSLVAPRKQVLQAHFVGGKAVYNNFA